ncbi:MAG: hypothetical protein AAFZ15_10160 [Bacteroidota bacterium]
MLNPKILLKHFGIFWAIFIALQLLFSTAGVKGGLARINAAMLSNVMQRFLPEINLKAQAQQEDGQILFQFYNQEQADQLVKKVKKTGKAGKISVQNYDYLVDPSNHINMALAFLIAVFLATPLAWKKRFILAGTGIFLFYIYSFFRMTFRLKYEVSQLNIGLYESDPNSFLSLHKINNFLGSLGLIFMVIILIWALLVFSKKNMAQMKLKLS